MTTRNVTFNSAFCFETQSNLTIYNARETYWTSTNKYFNATLTFKCPDINCSALFTGVGIQPVKPISRAMHFRLKQNWQHDEACQFTNIINSNTLTHIEKSYTINQRLNPIPTHFKFTNYTNNNNSVITTDSNESQNTSKQTYSHHHNYVSNQNDFHTTSQLERLVDVFTAYTPAFLKQNKHLLSLNGSENRYFYNCFKPIKFFDEHLDIPNIFYGIISNVIKISSGYYIYFKDRSKKDALPISIYLTNSLINKYYKRKLLYEFFKLIPEKTSTAMAYFYGTTPTKIETAKGTKLYSINIQSLHQLWIEWIK